MSATLLGLSLEFGEQGDDSSTRTYLVELSSGDVGLYDKALTASGLPAVGSTLSGTSLVVTDRVAKPKAAGCMTLALVDVRYGKKSTQSGPTTGNYQTQPTASTDPTSLPTIYEIDEVVQSDIVADQYWENTTTQKPNLNVNGMPFDPPVTIQKYNELLTFTFNISSPVSTSIRGTVNSNSVTLLGRSGAQKFICRSVKSTKKWWTDPDDPDHPVAYYECRVSFEYNADGWGLVFPLVGFQAFFGSPAVLRDILIKDIDTSDPTNMTPVSKPQKLTATGTLETEANRQSVTFMNFSTPARVFQKLATWSLDSNIFPTTE